MRKSVITSSMSLLVAPVISGEDDNTDNHDANDPDMPCSNDICWTSWRCWYRKETKYDAKIGSRCGLPDNVYTTSNDGAQWNALVRGKDYDMTWTSAHASQEDDIVLDWLMFEAPGTESKASYHLTVGKTYNLCRTNRRRRERHVLRLLRQRTRKDCSGTLLEFVPNTLHEPYC